MRKILLIGAAVAALSVASVAPSQAGDAGVIVGGTSGAWTGGTIGFFLGGPVGAAIGAWTGGAVGATIGDRASDRAGGSVDFYDDAAYRIGDIVDDSIRLRRISGEPDYGYFRADGLVFIVDRDSREVVDIREG